jgi:AAA15 family ATPase/GTPase
MEKWIKGISGTVYHTNKNVTIDLDGKNLIITGANGSGKTSLLRAVYDKVFSLVSSQFGNGMIINIPNLKIFMEYYNGRKAIIYFFEEKRLSAITAATTAKGLSTEEENAKHQDPSKKFANNLEQHLVNMMNRQSLAITKDKNQELADKIEAWFTGFEHNLKVLFEDDTVKLAFDPDNLKFTICQENNPPYTFQTLSTGYRAIFDIYAELIMRTEYFKVLPAELTGVVFIDEIDSHLHVSLQRLILPFFANSFPNIQFIVTTHSPFVLMSTPNTVVFDLAKNELITEDLSYYTYSAVMKGLWNIKPISVNLEMDIKEIAQIVGSKTKDMARLNDLISKIRGREDALDNESRAFFMLGLEALQGGVNHV